MKLAVISDPRGIIPEGFDSYSFGLCPDCGAWQQLIDWRATHRLRCSGKANRGPRLLIDRGAPYSMIRTELDRAKAANAENWILLGGVRP